MNKIKVYTVVLFASVAMCFLFSVSTVAQITTPPKTIIQKDTFFLAKKHGLLGRLGKSIATDVPADQPGVSTIKNVADFAAFKGMVIHEINIVDVSFGVSVNDTSQVMKNYLIKVANHLHKPTQERLIRTNLFFHKGEALSPSVISENVRYLRSLSYLQDARIQVVRSKTNKREVDINVFYKDVFSFGAVADVSGKAVFTELRDNNIMGTGQQLVVQNLYDLNRNPHYGGGIEYIKRNIYNSFFNFSVGYQNVAGAYSDGKRDETYAFVRATLPLVSPYYSWTGGAEISTHYNANRYYSDSLFTTDNQYHYNDYDAWVGYNISGRRLREDSIAQKTKHFLAVRVIDMLFDNLPDKYKLTYNPQYANINAVLGAYTFFKQEYYHANYIYGFGRNEDVPEGYNISFIGGWTNKNGLERPYAGINLEDNYFTQKKDYLDYSLKVGSYFRNKRPEDLSILFDLQTFTRLRKLNSLWYTRSFFSGSVAHQFNRLLDAPLILNSAYGIPQFSEDSTTQSTTRLTLNAESVFYDTWKLAGFSFAPFAFTTLSVLKTETTYKGESAIDGYAGVGLGLRTRNENLIFGTIELRTFYFPKTVGTMSPFNITVTTDLSYKFNSQYIRRPDFVTFN